MALVYDICHSLETGNTRAANKANSTDTLGPEWAITPIIIPPYSNLLFLTWLTRVKRVHSAPISYITFKTVLQRSKDPN